MAYNLSQKIRKNRISVPMRFHETITDANSKKTERYNIYNVYVTPSLARTLD